ncbi:hypothetical protein [Salinibaculum rarum]|uniref:hypothetical protein n=1 Tax=Salinibaculum rarum TaxID=3058903 RepID=UPI00265DBD0B|nr:hypothetical protein [Salinibaculum sp. KK48]
MKSWIYRANEFQKTAGFYKLFKRTVYILYISLIWIVYGRTIRPFLPETGQYVQYNGRAVFPESYGDRFIPWFPDKPNYEENYVACIQDYIEEGERVVVIGGGWGVSTVVAAESVGKTGEVIVFEGSEQSVQRVEQTIRLNGVENRVAVNHTIVGERISLRGNEGGAAIKAPEELPECDVLLIDSDGAELSILRKIEIRPDLIIAEHHAVCDESGVAIEYQPDTMIGLFTQLGYTVRDQRTKDDHLCYVAMRSNG